MKKQLWIVCVILTGSFLSAGNLLAQGSLAQGSPAKDQPAPAVPDSSAAAGAQSATKGKTPDRAAAYYHFALAHMY